MSSSPPVPARRCWAEIDLDALRHNARVVRNLIGRAARIMAVVKANAYGHGVSAVAEALRDWVEMFGVADVREAMELTEKISPERIYILGPAVPEERAEIVNAGFLPCVSSVAEAEDYARIVRGRNRAEPFLIHVDIDTGMGRVGICERDAVTVIEKIGRFPEIRIAGVSTHLPVADEDENFTKEQLARFDKITRELRIRGDRPPVIHALNSAGTIRFSTHAHDMVRAGLMLYGSSPISDFQKELRPVMTLKTRVTLVREIEPGCGISYGRTLIVQRPTRVATLAIGYADGFQRHLSNRGAEVLIRGRRCAVLGRVTMDQIIADVSALPEVTEGEEVVLIGRQGDEEILASELAQKAGTIAWEIFTGIGNRVDRIYVSAEN